MTEGRRGRRAIKQTQYVWLAGAVLFALVTGVYVLVEHTFQGAMTFAFISAMFLCGFMATTSYAEGRDAGYDIATTAAAEKSAADERERRRREAEAREPCEITFEGVTTWPDEGHLYVLKFSTGVIKVGQTLDLPRRIREHRRDAEAFGAVIVDCWFSPAHNNYLENEVELILMCDEAAPWRSKREYFHGIDIEDAIKFAATLTYYTASVLPVEEVTL
jgi:hypothetical protein